MNVDTRKVELINWIVKLNDQHAIKIPAFKIKQSARCKKSDTDIIGLLKHLIEYTADKFNDTCDLKEYQKKNYLIDTRILVGRSSWVLLQIQY